jgi:hypothetical protein
MAYACQTPIFKWWSTNVNGNTKFRCTPTGFSPTSQQTIHQATQRPATFARELADSELNTGSHPIITAGACGGDTRRPFAKGSCNRSALRVRSTT